MDVGQTLLLIFFAWLGWLAIKRFLRSPGASRTSRPAAEVTPAAFHWPDPGGAGLDVVGESHYRRDIASAIGHSGPEHANAETQALLVPEDKNPHDSKAVAIHIAGFKVGHLSREDARSFRRRLGAKKLTDKTTSCDALVSHGGVVNGKRFDYSVNLRIKEFD